MLDRAAFGDGYVCVCTQTAFARRCLYATDLLVPVTVLGNKEHFAERLQQLGLPAELGQEGGHIAKRAHIAAGTSCAGVAGYSRRHSI